MNERLFIYTACIKQSTYSKNMNKPTKTTWSYQFTTNILII